MLKPAPKKQRPPGLESEPRSFSGDDVELLNYVRKELKRQKQNADDELAQKLQEIRTGMTPAQREALVSWFRAKPRPRLDPLKANIAKAKLDRGASLQKQLNEQTSGTGIKVRVIVPKEVREHRRSRFKRGVPPDVVKMARDILAIMHRHFTPKQRKSWLSAGTMATLLFFEDEHKAVTEATINYPDIMLDDDNDGWPEMIDERLRRGDEKRKGRPSPKAKNARMEPIK